MAVVNLVNDAVARVNTRDSIVIIDNFESVRGGRSLDVSGFAGDVIEAGHVVIKDASGNYKPMPVTGSAYATLPEDHVIVGVLVATISKAKPLAGIMVRGTVNEVAAKYAYTAAMKTAFTARINLTQDKA